MDNVVRKAIRVIVDQLGQLEKCCKSTERLFIQDARISLIKADTHDFHLNPKKRYVEPKSDFKFDEK